MLHGSYGVTLRVNFLWVLQRMCNSSLDNVTGLQPAAGHWQDASDDISEPSVPASRTLTIPMGMYSCCHKMDFMNKAKASAVSPACQERLRWGAWEANSLHGERLIKINSLACKIPELFHNIPHTPLHLVVWDTYKADVEIFCFRKLGSLFLMGELK